MNRRCYEFDKNKLYFANIEKIIIYLYFQTNNSMSKKMQREDEHRLKKVSIKKSDSYGIYVGG